jgi:N-terminal acetyltransferase B complex non-catalytic subunit
LKTQCFTCIFHEQLFNFKKELRENHPVDELVILAAHQLQCVDTIETKKIHAICFLEDAMQHSPYNPKLKIAAILAYSQFNASSMCWDIYNTLHIKHVQHESCSYLILNILLSGGLYREILQVCQDILGLQRTSVREAGEFTGRAMENGSISKADEFLSFHTKRMQRSLVTLEAKGLVLDCAPMFSHDQAHCVVGSLHGIVGAESDLPRVKQMISALCDPTGAFSLLTVRGSVKETTTKYSDNRDESILSFEILHKTDFDTPEQIVSDSIRRSWLHNFLLRAALCVEATKGPKKGKAIKPSHELAKRCKSLLCFVSEADAERQGLNLTPGHYWLLDSIKKLCESLVSVCSGLTSNEDVSFELIEGRENAGVLLLQKAAKSMRTAKGILSQTETLSISRSCKLVSDFIVPIFAIFQMISKVAELFGWGKRKQKTKIYSDAVAVFAQVFLSLVDELHLCSSRITLENLSRNLKYAPCNFVTQSSFDKAVSTVFKSQQVTSQRMANILIGIKEVLTSFGHEG